MNCNKQKETIFQKLKSLSGFNKDYTDTIVQCKKVALVGNPNVGKSVIFNSLTGAYVTVSNYPGTTVDVSRGYFIEGSMKTEIIDTPGMYSIIPISEEERVTRNLLMDEKPDLVIHVVDAKNLGRMLPLTLQLIEAGFYVVLVLNIMDEAKMLGIGIDLSKMEKLLGIPVISTSAALNIGLSELKKIIWEQIKNAA